MIDLHIAGPSAYLQRRAAAVDRAGEVVAGVVVLVRRVGQVNVDVAGAGGGLQVEVGVVAEVEFHAAGAALQRCQAVEVSVGVNVAGAGVGDEAAVQAVDMDPAGSGAGLDVACGEFAELDVAGAGLESAGPEMPRARTLPEPLVAVM